MLVALVTNMRYGTSWKTDIKMQDNLYSSESKLYTVQSTYQTWRLGVLKKRSCPQFVTFFAESHSYQGTNRNFRELFQIDPRVFPFHVFSSPGSSIPDLGQWVSESVPLLNFDTKSDFWHLKLFRHLIKTRRQKDQKAKIQNKGKILQKGKKQKRQKESLMLWCQGSFALLQGFSSSVQYFKMYWLWNLVS